MITELEIRNMKEPSGSRPVRLYDGSGLFLYRTKRKRVWKLRYHIDGRERWLSLGEYPVVSLKAARQLAGELRNRIAQGEDPKRVADDTRPDRFIDVSAQWLAHAGADWTEKTRHIASTWLETDVPSDIAHRRMDDIEAPDLLRVLRKVDAAGHAYKVRRLHSYMGRIFAFAISHGLARRNPASDLVLRDLFGKTKRVHRPAFVTADDAKRLMRAIDAYGNPVVRGALLMLAWTLSRPGEVRSMRWEDIDMERQQWRYLVTKTNTPHAVPLPDQAIALLDELRPLTGRWEYVFPGERSKSKPLSDNTLNAALRVADIDTRTEHCAHGFRAMGRTLLAEMGYKPEVIERQLCHRQANDTVAAYARETLLDERTTMMQAWADVLHVWTHGADIVPLRANEEAR